MIFMLLDRQSRSWFLRPQPYLAALLAILMFLPVIVWNARHDWASFVFQSQGRINDAVMFSSHKLLGGILLLITPAGFLAFLHFLMHGRTTYERFHAVKEDRGRREYLFALCMVLVPLSVFFAFSLGKEVKLNWTGPLWLGLLPYMALTMRDLGRRVAVDGFIRWMRRLWPVTAMIVMLLYAALLHYVTLGLPAVANMAGPFQTGRRELAGEVEKIVARVERKTGRRPLVVGMDPVSAGQQPGLLSLRRRRPSARLIDRSGDRGDPGLACLRLEGLDVRLLVSSRIPRRPRYAAGRRQAGCPGQRLFPQLREQDPQYQGDHDPQERQAAHQLLLPAGAGLSAPIRRSLRGERCCFRRPGWRSGTLPEPVRRPCRRLWRGCAGRAASPGCFAALPSRRGPPRG